MKTPAKMFDLRHVSTGLSAEDKHLAILESRRLMQIRDLGDRYLLDKRNAPKRGAYDHRGMPVPA